MAKEYVKLITHRADDATTKLALSVANEEVIPTGFVATYFYFESVDPITILVNGTVTANLPEGDMYYISDDCGVNVSSCKIVDAGKKYKFQAGLKPTN